MKLMNSVRAGIAGEVVEVLIAAGWQIGRIRARVIRVRPD